MMTRAALTATFVLAAALAGGTAAADATASCDAVEIAATKSKDPSISPELKPLEKRLSKPPLSGWNSFKLLSRSDLTLELMKTSTTKLSSGQVSVILREIDQREGKRPRLTLGITMDGQSGKRIVETKVTVDVGDYTVVGETLAPNNDGHFVIMTCKL